MGLIKKLEKRKNEVNSCICIGLDPDESDITNFMKNEKENGFTNIKNNLNERNVTIIEKGREILLESFENLKEKDEFFYFLNHFCFYIINVTKEYALAYKMNFAFYIPYGSLGVDALKNVFDYLYSINIPTILDIKVNDIGNTLKNYRKFIFEYLKNDSCTVNIYMGTDILKYICFDEINKKYYSVFVLIKTSNPDSHIFQNQLSLDHKKTYMLMAEKAVQMSRELKMEENNEFVGFVVGSNCYEDMKIIREKFPDCYILSPGIGAQNGDLYKTLEIGCSKNYDKILINIGRAITKSSDPKQTAESYYNQASQFLESFKKNT